MPFGTNYSYNPYVNPYASPYQQQYQQPTQMPTQMPAQQSNGFVWVDGIEEANNFYVAPNNAVQLWDKNSPCIYKKSADSTGKPSMQIFDLVERKMQTQPKSDLNADFSDFVKRSEITQLEERIAKLERPKGGKRIKEDVDDG